jgi:hypothetical protein
MNVGTSKGRRETSHGSLWTTHRRKAKDWTSELEEYIHQCIYERR